jgi:hypothetical protein
VDLGIADQGERAGRKKGSTDGDRPAAWEKQRNAERARIKWMFTTEKARAKMGRAYPKPDANRPGSKSDAVPVLNLKTAKALGLDVPDKCSCSPTR